MVHSLLLTGALLMGSAFAPKIRLSADSSNESSASTKTISITGETYNPSETPIYVGDNDLKRNYIPAGNIYDTFGVLNDLFDFNFSAAGDPVTITATVPSSYGSSPSYVTYSASGTDETFKTTLKNVSNHFNNSSSRSYGFNTGYTDYFNVYQSYRFQCSVYYSDFKVEQLEDLYLLETFHIGQSNQSGFSTYQSQLNLVSVVIPAITITSFSNYDLDFTITTTPSSYRLLFDENGALVEDLPLGLTDYYQKSSCSICKKGSVVTDDYGTIDFNDYPADSNPYYRNLFINNTSSVLTAGVTTYNELYSNLNKEPTIKQPLNYGVRLAPGYDGYAPYYLGTITDGPIGWLRSSDNGAMITGTYSAKNGSGYIYQNSVSPETAKLQASASVASLTPESDYLYLNNTSSSFASRCTLVLTDGEKIVQPVVINVIDMNSFIWLILTIPFTFFSQAFNVTIFSGTPYAFNLSNLLLGLLGFVVIVCLIKFVIGFMKGHD